MSAYALHKCERAGGEPILLAIGSMCPWCGGRVALVLVGATERGAVEEWAAGVVMMAELGAWDEEAREDIIRTGRRVLGQ